ncbi:MAG TPA: hypothetical protein VG204_09755 [Terriglobia bacterium]|nr:hypothetical protein [Terriglobia bacterium]
MDYTEPTFSGMKSTKLGIAWVALCLAFVLHVVDESSTGFLSVYNPTVLAIRARLPWFPMPVFEYKEWLAGLIVANVVLLGLSPFVFQGKRWMRPLAYFFAALMLANGLGHTLGTVAGRTVASVRFPRPMPGFYSSPVILAAAIYLLVQLRATRSINSRREPG